jgi:hypothetical protein
VRRRQAIELGNIWISAEQFQHAKAKGGVGVDN